MKTPLVLTSGVSWWLNSQRKLQRQELADSSGENRRRQSDENDGGRHAHDGTTFLDGRNRLLVLLLITHGFSSCLVFTFKEHLKLPHCSYNEK